jgi:amidohydrolase
MRIPIRVLLILAFVGASTTMNARSDGPTWLPGEIKRVSASVVDGYEQIHEYPELGKKEFRTAEFGRSRLKQVGFTEFVVEPTLPTAVIAVLNTGRPGRVIVLRSELDARPGDEKAPVEYKSRIPGVMHSCGHDAHTAMLLGVAEILFRHSDSLAGKIVFLFQPAEETPGGADDIVRDGILPQLHASMIFAQHVAPGLPVGTIQVSPGPIMASSTYFTATVHGPGSHAASPQDGADVVRSAAELVNDMSLFPARHLDAISHPAVVSITHFEAGDHKALNILPEDAIFEGTVRSYDEVGANNENSVIYALNKYMISRAAANSVALSIDWRIGAPVSINDTKLFNLLVPTLAGLWSGPFLTQGQRSMYSEDFAYYTSQIPSIYFSLGIAKGDRGIHGVHTNEFDISLDALSQGTEFMSLLAVVAGQHQ